MIHPRDQWFRIYVFTPGKAAPVVDAKTKEVSVEWIELPAYGLESQTEHVHHPDAYHPDARVRIAHHRQILAQGFAVAACGHAHDPRRRIVETAGKPEKPCAKCASVTSAAKIEHEKIAGTRGDR